MADWDRRLLNLAKHYAEWSKDRSTKVGAVIIGPGREVVSQGYNGFARGVNDDIDERHSRPLKAYFTIHAEANSIANAARMGACTDKKILFCTHMPCSPCANLITQAGIIKVYCPKIDKSTEFYQRWKEDFDYAMEIFGEAGVEIVHMEN